MQDLLSHDYGLDPDKIVIVPNGLNDATTCQSVDQKTLKKKWHIMEKERIILFVGRMEDIKGGHFLVRTFMKVLEDYPESRLMIIGDGNYDLFLRNAKPFFTKITFTGLLNKEDLYRIKHYLYHSYLTINLCCMKQCIKTNGVLFFFCLISLIITAQEQSVQSNIKCLNYPSSFELLLRHFKGKIVYIDVMASWCKPCLAELKEYEKTDDFFKKNDIVRLFISIDEPKDWNACLKRLDERLLNGYFVTYHRPENSVENNKFSVEVEKLFVTYDEKGNFAGLSVPQFIIVNREGTIVEYKAQRPSNPEELKNQLKQYLE